MCPNLPAALLLTSAGQRRLYGAFRGDERGEHDAQVHDVERVDAEIPEVVVDRARDFLGGQRRVPGALRTAFSPTSSRSRAPSDTGGAPREDLIRACGHRCRWFDVIDAACNRFA